MTHQRRLRWLAPPLLCLAIAMPSVSQRAYAAQSSYVVRQGDTLSAIALRYGTTVSLLLTANALSNPNQIVVGQVLQLTCDTTTMAATAMSSTNTSATATSGAGSSGYTVVSGDTLSAISQRLGVSLASLAATNGIQIEGLIVIGERLKVPATGGGSTTPYSAASYTSPSQSSTYAVRSGDTLSAIASRYGVSLAALAAANNIGQMSLIVVGQRLTIPSGGAAVPATAGPSTTYGGSIESILTSESQAAGVDPALIKGLAWQESGWQMVTASDGGMGVMQLMPATVDWVSSYLLGYRIDPYDPTQNIRAGVALFRYELRQFGDVRSALAAYHQGITSVRTQGILPDTYGYIANILALQSQYAG